MNTMPSSGLVLVQHVWEKVPRISWERLNHSMNYALRLAIGSLLEFTADDLAHIDSTMRVGYWLGERGWEYPYALAISVDNMSFVKAFEEWQKREPFIANNVEMGGGEGFVHSSTCRAQRGRLALGFSVGGQRGDRSMEVTSITNERVVLCVYGPRNEYPRRPIKRLTLNHDQVKAMFPAPKKAKKEKAE